MAYVEYSCVCAHIGELSERIFAFCVHRPVKEEQKLPQPGPGSLHGPYHFANTGPSLAAPGQLYQQPANVYTASQNYLHQNQPLQQPLRNLSVAQGPSATSHPYQPHVSSQSVNQSTSGFRLQPAVNPYVGQQQAAGQYVYGNGQPHPMQQRTVTDAESRKRKAESTQVPSRLMCCCLLDALSHQVIEPDGALGAIWC